MKRSVNSFSLFTLAHLFQCGLRLRVSRGLGLFPGVNSFGMMTTHRAKLDVLWDSSAMSKCGRSSRTGDGERGRPGRKSEHQVLASQPCQEIKRITYPHWAFFFICTMELTSHSIPIHQDAKKAKNSKRKTLHKLKCCSIQQAWGVQRRDGKGTGRGTRDK